MIATLTITDADNGRVDIQVVLSEPIDPERQPKATLPASFRLMVEVLEQLVNDPDATMDSITLTSPEGEKHDVYRKGGQG